MNKYNNKSLIGVWGFYASSFDTDKEQISSTIVKEAKEKAPKKNSFINIFHLVDVIIWFDNET